MLQNNQKWRLMYQLMKTCLYQDKSDLPVKKRSFFNQRADSTLLNKIPRVIVFVEKQNVLIVFVEKFVLIYRKTKYSFWHFGSKVTASWLLLSSFWTVMVIRQVTRGPVSDAVLGIFLIARKYFSSEIVASNCKMKTLSYWSVLWILALW